MEIDRMELVSEVAVKASCFPGFPPGGKPGGKPGFPPGGKPGIGALPGFPPGFLPGGKFCRVLGLVFPPVSDRGGETRKSTKDSIQIPGFSPGGKPGKIGFPPGFPPGGETRLSSFPPGFPPGGKPGIRLRC